MAVISALPTEDDYLYLCKGLNIMKPLNIVLFEPEIPPNTGNIIRLSANIGANLHLIKPYGFNFDDKSLQRAGLDYQALTKVTQYKNLDDYLLRANPKRLFCATTKTKTYYTDMTYQAGDAFLFGPETRGLPKTIRDKFACITLPMAKSSRSLNLSNAVAIITYEAWRQLSFY